MMTSVDYPASSRSSHQPSHQVSASNTRHNTHIMRYAAPPRSSSAGRTKTEQVVLEFLYKAAELIVQSRVNFQAEPGLRRGNRRARFNLDIDEVQMVRDAMAPWKEDVRLPLAIDIFWEGDGQRVLLERWSVTFAEDDVPSNAHLGSTQDVIQQLKEICKRISVLLRALFSFMRQLPAHRLFVQSYPSMLSYQLRTAPSNEATRAFEAQRVAASGYSFLPIATPFGLLKVAAVYRRDCDQFTEEQEQVAPSRIFQDNFIIQDYVPGSPELVPANAPVTAPLPSIAQPDSPVRAADLRTDSFVPVSDTVQFGGNIGTERHHRSTPRSIPIPAATPQQLFSNTPPRHPKTISLLRNSRTSPVVLHRPSSAGHESHPTPASLDNFTLDSGSPSPLQQYGARHRKGSFNGAFVSDNSESGSIGPTASPFMKMETGGQNLEIQPHETIAASQSSTETAASAIRPSASARPPTDGMPIFSSSPPFQANPCELLSTSPGYSYSKNYLQPGSSNVPTFITTDQFQLGVQDAKRSSFSSSAGLISAKARSFSPDFSDSGVTVWGISPDTPDAFGLALVDAGNSSSGSLGGGRHRFLPLSGNAEMGGDTNGQGDDFLDAGGNDMMLPFAIRDASVVGSTATTATDSTSTGAGSTLQRSSRSLETASVGNFLDQLRHAPRLSMLASASVPGQDADEIEKQEPPAPVSVFDDELAGFRSLRDELAKVF